MRWLLVLVIALGAYYKWQADAPPSRATIDRAVAEVNRLLPLTTGPVRLETLEYQSQINALRYQVTVLNNLQFTDEDKAVVRREVVREYCLRKQKFRGVKAEFSVHSYPVASLYDKVKQQTWTTLVGPEHCF